MPTNMQAFLTWLVSPDGGSFIVVAVFASVFAERLDAWHKLDSTVKAVVMIVLATLLGAGAHALLLHPDVVAAIDPYYQVFCYSILAYLATQGTHVVDKFLKTWGSTGAG